MSTVLKETDNELTGGGIRRTRTATVNGLTRAENNAASAFRMRGKTTRLRSFTTRMVLASKEAGNRTCSVLARAVTVQPPFGSKLAWFSSSSLMLPLDHSPATLWPEPSSCPARNHKVYAIARKCEQSLNVGANVGAKEKGNQLGSLKSLIYLVRPARLERATFWFVAKRSIQLSYGRD